MKIPKKVKIGGHIYRVILEQPSRIEEDSNCGRGNRDKGEIYISADLIQSQKEVTFFHEIIHQLNGEIKEENCDWLAEALYAFLKDNNLLA